jgi:hypothetical protein
VLNREPTRPPGPQERAREQLLDGGGPSCGASCAANASSLPAATCALLCPVGGAAFAAADAVADAAADAAGGEAGGIATARVAAAGLVALLLAAPFCGVSYLRKVPFGQRHAMTASGHQARHTHTLLHVLSYRLDQFFSTNAASKPLALLALTALLVLCGSVALYAVSGDDPGALFWASLAGVGLDWTFAGEEGTTSAHRAVALLLSVGGMLITALLLGVVSDTIGAKMDDLRTGRSDVLETGHTLILGWSDKLLPIIRQLTLANESMGGGVVVILAERDKQEMDEEVATYMEEHDAAGTKVVCRTGSPLLTATWRRCLLPLRARWWSSRSAPLAATTPRTAPTPPRCASCCRCPICEITAAASRGTSSRRCATWTMSRSCASSAARACTPSCRMTSSAASCCSARASRALRSSSRRCWASRALNSTSNAGQRLPGSVLLTWHSCSKPRSPSASCSRAARCC